MTVHKSQHWPVDLLVMMMETFLSVLSHMVATKSMGPQLLDATERLNWK